MVSCKIVCIFAIQTLNTNTMHRTEVLCPECMKGKLLKEDSTTATGSGYCDRCGERFVFTGTNRVRYATASDKPDQPKAMPEPAKPKMKFYATIMSEDPDPDCAEDPHQKYGMSDIIASDKKEAEAEARRRFSEEYDGLPIHWVEISNGVAVV